jgi:hypothetical protein
MSTVNRPPVHVIPNDLGRWDQARPGDLMLVPIWTDVRPLRGASGLLDWRMCGRLSSFMLAGKVTGAEGEQTLFPSGGRLAWRLVLAVGGGARADFSEKQLRALVRRSMGTLRGLGATRVALALPGRDADAAAAAPAPSSPKPTTTPATSLSMSAKSALDRVLAEVDAHPGVVADLTLLVPAAAQKEVAEVLRLRAVRS